MGDPGAGLLVGRDRERAVLAQALRRALAGRSDLVLVSGEAGIGKTALVEDLVRTARDRNLRVLHGQADEGDPSTFGLWREPSHRLAVAVAPPSGSLPADERRWEVLDELIDAIGRAAPLCLVLEDVQWADELSLWILERLPPRLTGSPALIVATCRVDAPGAPALPSLRPTSVIRLAGLTPPDVARLVADLHPEREVDAEELCRRTGGNPLFVREVLAWSPEFGRIPPVVGQALESSLQALTGATRSALAALALGGPDCPLSVAATAVGLTTGELRTCLDEALSAHVLLAGSRGRIEFRHALLAEAAIALLGPDGERELQRALAAGWEAAVSSPAHLGRGAASLLAAVPLVDARAAAEAALRAAQAASANGDPAGGAHLLQSAVEALDMHAADADGLRARLLVELGECRSALGDAAGATAVFDAAAEVAARSGDSDLRVLAECGACRHINPFIDHPLRRVRLADADRALEPGDHPSRVVLLGRLAVAGAARADLREQSARLADQAVAMARRLDDPVLLATALVDRHLVPSSSVDLDARSREAEEMIALGERARRTDLVLIGYQWLYRSRLDQGDLVGARDSLDTNEMLASLMPSPTWRHAVMLRRASLALLDGERSGALDLLDRAMPLARGALPEEETLGVEHGVRTIFSRLTGIADPRLPGVQEQFAHSLGRLPVAFFQIHLAASSLVLGDEATARRIVSIWASDLPRAGAGPGGPSNVALLGSLVADLELTHHVRGVRTELSTLSTRYSPESTFTLELSTFAAEMPIDTILGRLALLEGDVAGAHRHLELGLALVRSMPSPLLEARCLWELARAQAAAGDAVVAEQSRREAQALAAAIGIVLPGRAATTAVPPARGAHATMRRLSTGWLIESPQGRANLDHSVALEQLARLLAAAPSPVSAVELSGSTPAATASDLGPLLDAEAKRAYRRRIEELHVDIDDADADADLERAERARLELEALIAELRRAVGLGGRDRPQSSGAERARINVARNLRRAVRTVSHQLPTLGAHLEVSIRTGRWCSYSPDPGAIIFWEVSP